MNIHVLDNFYPDDVINAITNIPLYYGWKFGKTDDNKNYYWNIPVYGINYERDKSRDILYSKFEIKEVKSLWDIFSKKFGVSLESLEACYFNGLTHGNEAYTHIDFFEPGSTTCILYVCEGWNSYWSGETIFLDGEWSSNPSDSVFYKHDIIKSVLPKTNRMVLFDGNIMHAVRPLSKSFTGLRTTLMFKIKNVSVEKLIENYNNLIEVKDETNNNS
jgi:SM-20-related protein